MEPRNEMEVMAYFAANCESRGWRIINLSPSFPDAVLEEIGTGKTYLAEFEYAAFNFVAHEHDPRRCDLIICWVNDFPGCLLPILSLSAWDDFVMCDVDMEEKNRMYTMLQENHASRALWNPVVPRETIDWEGGEKPASILQKPDGTLVVHVHLTFRPGIDDELIDMVENAPPRKLAETLRRIALRGLNS